MIVAPSYRESFKELIDKANRGVLPTSTPPPNANHNRSKKIEVLAKTLNVLKKPQKPEENIKKTVFKNREHFLDKKVVPQNHSAHNFYPSSHLDEDFNYVSLDENIYNKNVENIHATLLKPKTSIKELDTPSYLPNTIKEEKKTIRKEEKVLVKESKQNSSFSLFESFLERTKKAFLPKKKGTQHLCDCSRDDDNLTCNRALNWLRKFEKEEEWHKLKRIYNNLQKEKAEEESVIQIEKDLMRTFPTEKCFEKDSEG